MVPEKPPFTVRLYLPEDREAIRSLCCDTGYLGHPVENVFQDRRWFADFNTNNESEFLHRDYEKAKMALEEGRKILNGAGVTCYGFTSPTWFQSQEAVQAIEDFGFRYFTTHSAIFDCEKQKRHSSMAMGFQRKKYIAYR